MRERPRRKETDFAYFLLAEPVAAELLRGEALAHTRERLKKPCAP